MLHPKRTPISFYSTLFVGLCILIWSLIFLAQSDTSWARSEHLSSGSPLQETRSRNSVQAPGDASKDTHILDNVIQISVGYYHSCALKESGEVYCWGGNQWGQLGTGDRRPSPTAVKAQGLPQDVIAVDAGLDHTCALTSSGDIKCWGSGYTGQLGDGMVSGGLTPADVGSFSSNVVNLTVGESHACGLTNGGDMMCWGANHFGELGIGSAVVSQTLPVNVAGLEGNVQSIATGSNHTCAVTTDGAAKCWGQNSFGEVGNGTNDEQRSPQDVFELTTGVREIFAGVFRSCAVMESGNAKCWGHGGFAALGDGRSGHSNTPVNVVNLSSTVEKISIGQSFTCALLDGGGVECWGGNEYGQLGDGSTTARSAPVSVMGLSSGVSDISSHSTQSCALVNRGVKCWGRNPFLDQSNESLLDSLTPVDVMVDGQSEPDPPNPTSDFSCSAVNEIPQSECTALVTFYESLGGPNWNTNADWLQTDTPCAWWGVSCENGNVVALVLRENGLSGEIPASIAALTQLRVLSLATNQISGTIPAEITRMSSLVRLILSGNQLSGTIPTHTMPANAMPANAMPVSDMPATGNALGQLQTLDLNDNQLEGAIPSALGELTDLTDLNLGRNRLNGDIPLALTKLAKLESLKLHNNALTGKIPSDFDNLQALEVLRLEENSLDGPLPARLGELTNLNYLSLYGNNFGGPIPEEFGNLIRLTHLAIQNNELTGPIPSTLGNLTLLEELTLNNNQLEGEVPESLKELTELTKIYLQVNNLAGAIPSGLGNLANLIDLRINNTDLSGPLPSELVGLSNLEFFDFKATDLCEPADQSFLQWLNTIESLGSTNVACEDSSNQPTPTPTPPAPPTQPSVELTGNNTGAPGSTFVIQGRDFPANTVVTIVISSEKPIVVETNSNGEFWLVLVTKEEAGADSYTVTVANAGSVAITLDENARINRDEAPADQQASTVEVEVPSTMTKMVMLPFLSNVLATATPAPPDPEPEPMWASVGAGPRLVRALSISNGILYVAQSGGDGVDGGLHQKAIVGCDSGLPFSRIPGVDGHILSIDFSESQGIGVAAAWQDGIYYLNAGGWNNVTEDALGNDLGVVYAVSIVNDVIYAGANDLNGNEETNGKVYQSADGGATWNLLLNTPAVMNVIEPVTAVNLWLGTNGAGIQQWTVGSDSLVSINPGLTTDKALKVWDMVVPDVNRLYIATDDGVYQRTSAGAAWTPLGDNLRGLPARSLAVVDNELYVGTKSDDEDPAGYGVHQLSLTAPTSWAPITNGVAGAANWEVRALLHDETYCNGMLAGTNEGVFVLR